MTGRISVGDLLTFRGVILGVVILVRDLVSLDTTSTVTMLVSIGVSTCKLSFLLISKRPS